MAKDKKDLIVRSTPNINSAENKESLKKIEPDLIVVVGTRRLKKDLYSIAEKGAINLHCGILPFYRGADSEFWALCYNHPDEVGLSIHFLDEELDAGDIILQEKLEVKPKDSHSRLRKKNIYLGAKKLNEAIALIESGSFKRKKQDNALARTFLSAQSEEIARMQKRRNAWLRRSGVIKVFGNAALNTREEVVRKPLVGFMAGLEWDWPNIFCLRIDADEYDVGSFSNYFSLFKKYTQAITMFINAHSFEGARNHILECKDTGLDIQSHGFYHYVYSDFQSNLYNLQKSASFFNKLGINTKGFAAPMGRWNKSLILALERAGYEYSSDFSYDYLGLPSYPSLGNRISDILEIPVFPVAPELFLQQGYSRIEDIFSYYKAAIDEMIACAIPVIIYGHTSSFQAVPQLLFDITDYALNTKGLQPLNLTNFSHWWEGKDHPVEEIKTLRKTIRLPQQQFLGRKTHLGAGEILKKSIKNILDFERITPDEELCCSVLKRVTKKIIRKIIHNP
jgi:folate-dependent phosphoribosylglycinamide formyltransferase PurN